MGLAPLTLSATTTELAEMDYLPRASRCLLIKIFNAAGYNVNPIKVAGVDSERMGELSAFSVPELVQKAQENLEEVEQFKVESRELLAVLVRREKKLTAVPVSEQRVNDMRQKAINLTLSLSYLAIERRFIIINLLRERDPNFSEHFPAYLLRS